MIYSFLPFEFKILINPYNELTSNFIFSRENVLNCLMKKSKTHTRTVLDHTTDNENFICSHIKCYSSHFTCKCYSYYTYLMFIKYTHYLHPWVLIHYVYIYIYTLKYSIHIFLCLSNILFFYYSIVKSIFCYLVCFNAFDNLTKLICISIIKYRSRIGMDTH